MRITFITPFPEILKGALSASILGRAETNDIVKYNIINLREFGDGPHKKVDDYPFSGGPGMVLTPGPIFKAFEDSFGENPEGLRVILPSPSGRQFTQQMAKELTEESEIVFICGHYKGVDERVIDSLVTDEISIGDYVLSGGEIPSLAISDSIVRLLDGALNDPESAETDSFTHPLLDQPHYTRPSNFRGMEVPEVLLSGDHEKIRSWKAEQRLKRTEERRSDLLQDKLN
ncbi:MAG: tRNA (guanosine(37)-N1)-methyltransferase TrmD [Candidatus Marinimicrobia bacterium]|nr:tRNA (guanosine(37)-N1)-methyltransferase TrmD [Candidatus Neomarinimicrobiota bacterium]